MYLNKNIVLIILSHQCITTCTFKFGMEKNESDIFSETAYNLKSAIQFIQNVVIKEDELNNMMIFKGIKSLFLNDDNVDIRYWNSYNGNLNSIKIHLGREDVIVKHWIPGLPLKVIIHGWLDSMNNTDGMYSIKKAYVDVGGFNVLSVNWSGIAGNKNYMWPVLMASAIGDRLSKVLQNIVGLGVVRPEDVHLIGHSLGAHIAGMCGTSFRSGAIGRITGLDPAGPGFEFAKLRKKGLKKTDAMFVDVIHTAAGSAGCVKALGHADFYPNGGNSPQPGCYEGGEKLIEIVGCSHSRAHRLYEDSVYNSYSMKAIRCASWTDYKSHRCYGNYSTTLGHGASPRARGNFYLWTKGTAPFAVSEHKEDL